MPKVYDLTESEIQIISLLRRTAPNIWHIAIQLGSDGRWITEEIREETKGLVVLQGKGATFDEAWTSRRNPNLSEPGTEAERDASQFWKGESSARVARLKPHLRLVEKDEGADGADPSPPAPSPVGTTG